MRRTTVWLWLTGTVLLLSVVILFGGWLALRQWPLVLGPRLPPSLAYALADWGPSEAIAARACFDAEYWEAQEFTPAQIDARNALLCAELRGTRRQQLEVLDFMPGVPPGSINGFVPTTPERDALIFALANSPDQEVRTRARTYWRTEGPPTIQILRRLTFDPNDRSPLAPDGWVAGPAGAIAWQMLVLQNSGYNHKTPTKYRGHLQHLQLRLSGHIREHGPLLVDPRDNALVLLVISEAYAMTNDVELKPLVERGRNELIAEPDRLERMWQQDTTTAVLTALVYRALLSGGIDASAMQSSLSNGIDTWWSGDLSTVPPAWFAQGQTVHATAAERWGALIVSLDFLNRHPTWHRSFPSDPPAWIADPSNSTPFGRYLIRLAGFLPSGKKWDVAFAKRRDALIAARLITPDHQPPEGFWPRSASISDMWETTFSLLELGIYRPYTPP